MSEENIADYIAAAFIGFFFCYILYTLFVFVVNRIRDGRDSYMLLFRGRLDTSIKSQFEKYLLGRFAYYDKLSEDQRIKFLLRVRKFIRNKRFEGRGDLVITDEIKVMVAAGAVQLTFGLENYILDFFSIIIIYPDSYYSPITKQYHQGEANPKGVIVISWKDLLRGYDIPNDTYNVGLHEMAHALELEKRLGGDYDFYFDAYYEKWKRITEEEYEKVSDEQESFFRSYAGTNRHEFFSVCIEHFFEATEEFKTRLPQIYHHLCILLNQDPLNRNYVVEEMEHKSLEEIELEIISSAEIFETRYSYTSLFSTSFIAALAFIFYASVIKSFHVVLLPIGVSFAFVFVMPSLFLFKRIALYDRYIVVRNYFGNLKAAFVLDDIVSVSFYPERNGNALHILTVSHGKIHKNTYGYNAKPNDVDKLRKLLEDKNVIVK